MLTVSGVTAEELARQREVEQVRVVLLLVELVLLLLVELVLRWTASDVPLGSRLLALDGGCVGCLPTCSDK